MDDIKEAAGRRGKTIQEARSMAMTRKDFRRWMEDPTLKSKRERQEEEEEDCSGYGFLGCGPM
jgi:hypothetical protein